MDIVLRKSRDSDLKFVEELLKEVKLPINGVSEQFFNFFIIEYQGRIIGTMGWEKYGSVGLMRSAAIHPEFQNKGLGSKLTQEIINVVKATNVKKLYLLTETAQRFSSKNGFKVINRSEVPVAIENSDEYANICQESALVMMREI